jgi:hypothetical protein
MTESRSNHYEKHRDRILERAKTYYKTKKDTDPTFYDKVLKRNSDRYHAPTFKHPSELTQEEKEADEAQMVRIMKNVRESREADERKRQRAPIQTSDPELLAVLHRAYQRGEQPDLTLSFI